jgi:hypothetical protein
VESLHVCRNDLNAIICCKPHHRNKNKNKIQNSLNIEGTNFSFVSWSYPQQNTNLLLYAFICLSSVHIATGHSLSQALQTKKEKKKWDDHSNCSLCDCSA